LPSATNGTNDIARLVWLGICRPAIKATLTNAKIGRPPS